MLMEFYFGVKYNLFFDNFLCIVFVLQSNEIEILEFLSVILNFY